MLPIDYHHCAEHIFGPVKQLNKKGSSPRRAALDSPEDEISAFSIPY
jgi:hypothetical protein